MSWLASGLALGDTYERKNYRFSFFVGHAPEGISPAKKSDAG